jgi:hypothetical protein
MIYISPEQREPGPMMREVEGRIQKAEQDAREKVLNGMTKEARDALIYEKQQLELMGKDPNSGPHGKEFEAKVLAELKNSKDPQEAPQAATVKTDYEKLMEDLLKRLEPSFKRSLEASALIADSDKLAKQLKEHLEGRKSSEQLVKDLSKFADQLESFAAATNSKELLKVVTAIRELEVSGTDMNDPAVRKVAVELFGELSAADSQIKIAQRESAANAIAFVSQEMKNFIGREAYMDAMRASGADPSEPKTAQTAPSGFMKSEEYRAVMERIKKINLTEE